MTHAIIEKSTKRVLKDANGYAHIYSSKEAAQHALDTFYAGRDDVQVVPW